MVLFGTLLFGALFIGLPIGLLAQPFETLGKDNIGNSENYK